jgi:hypothetical protein
MVSTNRILAVAALFLVSGIAHAEEPRTFNDLEVDRISATEVRIEFDYTGGVCEEVGPAEPGDVVGGTLSVTFQSASTAEVCTLRAVDIDVEQTLEADETVTHVAVALLAPDGTIMATGTEKVDLD